MAVNRFSFAPAVHNEQARHPEGQRALGYRPDLDGLRAISIAMVLVSHIDPAIPVGQAGVTAFFVLSGFLITSILMKEREAGKIDIGAFYRRRFRRLAPALIVVVWFSIVLGLMGHLQPTWPYMAVAALTYVSNWIIASSPTLESPLAQTWSLAVEEQFYLVLPILLALMGRRVLLLVPIAIVAAFLYRENAVGVHVYFDTWSRVDELLAGVGLAILKIRLPSWTGPIGLVMIVGIAIAVQPFDTGFGLPTVVLPIATVGALIVIAAEWRPLGRLAGAGKRAYSLYLWNSALIVPLHTVGVLLSIPVAELSYRFVERPFLSRRKARPTELIVAQTAASSTT